MSQGKTFRLFISSTFDDFRQERDLLRAKVFPEVKKYYASKGYTFQPIDLRWGITNEAQLDQKTMELCLEEVRACKSLPHPNFLLLLGDRYGWVPLPYIIEKQEFELLLPYIPEADKPLFLNWYREDLNQIPVSYILKERRTEAIEHEEWSAIESQLRTAFQHAADLALDESTKRKYFLSVTEAEVEEGIIPYSGPTDFQSTLLAENPDLEITDTQHLFGFSRSVDPNSVKSKRFIGEDYEKAQLFKERVAAQLPEENIFQVQTEQKNTEVLNDDYLQEFANRIIDFLKAQVDLHAQKQTETTELEKEIEAQRYFAQQKRQHFTGREDILQSISDYINGEQTEPLVIYGTSGIGKSALMSKAIEEAEAAPEKKVCYRFVGATADSGVSEKLLLSIFEEIGLDLPIDEGQKMDGISKETFINFSLLANDTFSKITEPVVIFIDAVNQLANEDQFLWLPNILPKNVKIILSALDDEKFLHNSRYFQNLNKKTNNFIKIKPFRQPRELLNKLLKIENRCINEIQEEYFLDQFKKVGSPLYVTRCSQEMMYWHSFDNIKNGSLISPNGTERYLSDSQEEMINNYILNLSKFSYHNVDFVNRVLGYIYLSRDGLSESELLELIGVDEYFIKQLAPDTFHKNYTEQLPIIIWVRLISRLKPFLYKKNLKGQELLYFSSIEFENVVFFNQDKKLLFDNILSAIRMNILKSQWNDFGKTRWGNIYSDILIDYFTQFNNENLSFEVEFIANLSNKKWKIDFLNSLIVDIEHFISNSDNNFALNFSKFLYNISLYLYNIDHSSWIFYFSKSNYFLALCLHLTNQKESSVKYATTSKLLIEDEYNKNNKLWVKDYVKSIELLALILFNKLSNTNLDNVYNLRKRNNILLEDLYLSDSKKWSNLYITNLYNFGSYYLKKDHFFEAENHFNKCYNIIIPLYNDKPTIWRAQLNYILFNLEMAHAKLGSTYHKIIEIYEEHKLVIQELYKQNEDKWFDDYEAVLYNLAILYFKTDNYVDALIIGFENKKIRIARYGKESESLNEIVSLIKSISDKI